MHRVYHDFQPPECWHPAYVRVRLTAAWEITLEIDSSRDMALCLEDGGQRNQSDFSLRHARVVLVAAAS
jgi:hypothetical protein